VLRIAGSAFLARLADPQRTHIVRLSVDRDRGRLWVADFKLVQVYALPGLEELRRYELPRDRYYERFGDLAIDNAGNAFVLSRGGARLYRIDSGSLDLEPWLDLDERAADAALLLANRILKSPDDRHLFLPSPTRGSLLRVDTRSKQVVTMSDAPNLVCGLLFWDSTPERIRAFDCTGRWEARIELAGDGLAAVAWHGEPRLPGTVTTFRP
jgi:hypothetical protein